MSGFVTDGNEINCHECKYGKNCNVGRGHEYRVGSCFQFELEKKQTNADRIRAMSDEEMANFMERTKFYVCKQVAEICGIYDLEDHWDKDGIVKEEIKWLKQETI